MFRSLLCFALFGTLIGTCSGEGQRQYKWKLFGPGCGGANFAVGFHAKDPRIMLTGTDMGALYRTANGGKHWDIVGNWANGCGSPGFRGAWRVLFDPVKTNIAWCASENGVYKSEDTGINWKRMTTSVGGRPNAYNCLALDPTNTDIIYIGQGNNPYWPKRWSFGKIWKSVDGGINWKTLPTPGGALKKKKGEKFRCFTNIAVDKNSRFVKGKGHLKVYIFGTGGFFKSEDAGENWSRVSSNSMPTTEISDLVLVNNDGKTILVGGFKLKKTVSDSEYIGGVFTSEDNGKNWKAINIGLEEYQQKMKSRYPRSHIMLAWSPAAPHRLYCGMAEGQVFRSDNLGKNWYRVSFTKGQWVKKDGGSFIAPVKGGNYKDLLKAGVWRFHYLATAYSNADYVAFTDIFSTFVSSDGGKHWRDALNEYGKVFNPGWLGERPPSPHTHKVRNRGASMIMAQNIAIDPFNVKNVFISFRDIGLQISRDGGNWWEWACRVPFHYRGGFRQAYCFTFDPVVKGRGWAAFGHDGRIYRTDDCGRTFKYSGIKQLEQKSKGLRKTGKSEGAFSEWHGFPIWQIVIDKTSPSAKRILYAATSDGIFKSRDGGKSWQKASKGLENAPKIQLLAISQSNHLTLYAGTGRVPGKNCDYGIYKSTDGGTNWQKISGKTFGAVLGMAVSKQNPEIIYVSAKTYGRNNFWGSTGLWRTVDGGKQWKKIDKRFNFGLIAVDPENSEHVYYGLCSRDLNKEIPRLLESLDGGKKWHDIGKTIPLCNPKQIIFDPVNKNKIYYIDHFGLYEGLLKK